MASSLYLQLTQVQQLCQRNSGTVMTTTKSAEHRYVTLQHAARHLSVTEQTIRRYIAEGRIQGYRIGKRALRVDSRDLDALLAPVPAARRKGISAR